MEVTITKEQMLEIKKWEDENWFLAAKLQEECLSYEHYLSKVLLCLEKVIIKNKDGYNEIIKKVILCK